MNRITECRTKVYDYFHSNDGCKKYFWDKTHKMEFVAYYNSMYLLQDSTESLGHHRWKGFSQEPLAAYLEFWGIMQAVIIQQDCIAEIFKVLTTEELNSRSMNYWTELRTLRNICAGHPVRKDRPKGSTLMRAFMGRSFGGYDSFTYERWEEDVGISHPQVKLGVLLDNYLGEAESKLIEAFTAMQKRWPDDG